MKKTFLKTTLSLSLFIIASSCSESLSDENSNEGAPTGSISQEPKIEEEVEEVIEASPFGELEGLIGSWTVDAATAGVKMDLTFGEDGSFKQEMGVVKGEGTWEMTDNQHIKIVTQNTKGQTWKITNLTENGVDLCWNPDKPNPKTIPMQRVK